MMACIASFGNFLLFVNAFTAIAIIAMMTPLPQTAGITVRTI
jgi:hypothetical protein